MQRPPFRQFNELVTKDCALLMTKPLIKHAFNFPVKQAKMRKSLQIFGGEFSTSAL